MADREQQVVARIAPGVGKLDRAHWDALAGGSDPFLGHAFLTALEESGSIGEGTGWTPAPIIVEGDGGAIAAAAPAYLKSHSQGEYVFDHGWADAFEPAGVTIRSCRSQCPSRRFRDEGCWGRLATRCWPLSRRW